MASNSPKPVAHAEALAPRGAPHLCLSNRNVDLGRSSFAVDEQQEQTSGGLGANHAVWPCNLQLQSGHGHVTFDGLRSRILHDLSRADLMSQVFRECGDGSV